MAVSPSAENEFLNIKQAAAYLNVSEVSLRRWTNSGELPCLRVGAKRERRFRKPDLIAFMAREGEPSPRNTPAGAVLEGIHIEPGSHLCTIYSDDKGRVKMAVPFLADGLSQGHACVLVAEDACRDAILASLRQIRPQADADLSAKRLLVLDGAPSVEAMCDALEERFVEAIHGGANAIRVVGDMTWHRRYGIEDDDLMTFESRYERVLGRRYPVVALCQYDARAFSGSSILEALIHHQDLFKYPTARFLG